MRDHQYEVWSAVPPHLTHMGTKHGEALDRTPMWTLDELCTVFRTTPAAVHTWRKHGRGPRSSQVSTDRSL